ncbi:hypothetical protein NY08_2477 [Rhodococcus sp. B7740]|nr:hypothetical protein NY08_2477 [Rhodococcus sp. B7740]
MARLPVGSFDRRKRSLCWVHMEVREHSTTSGVQLGAPLTSVTESVLGIFPPRPVMRRRRRTDR